MYKLTMRALLENLCRAERQGFTAGERCACSHHGRCCLCEIGNGRQPHRWKAAGQTCSAYLTACLASQVPLEVVARRAGAACGRQVGALKAHACPDSVAAAINPWILRCGSG